MLPRAELEVPLVLANTDCGCVASLVAKVSATVWLCALLALSGKVTLVDSTSTFALLLGAAVLLCNSAR